MRELIEQMKKANGNENITQKDLTWYTIGRIDDVSKQLTEFITSCNDKFPSKKTFWKVAGGLFTMIGALAWFVVVFK